MKYYFLLSALFISLLALGAYANEPIQIGTKTEDIILTNDLTVAKAQVAKYPNNPEARFNLAIALSRTSLVEEAIKELRRTKSLIRKSQNAGIIDKKINEYKTIIEQNENNDYTNNIRYRLAFSHYLKAYLISKDIKKAQGKKKKKKKKAESKKKKGFDPSQINILNSKSLLLLNDANPEIDKNLKSSLLYFNELLKFKPDDVWAKVYYGFILAEQYNEFKKAKTLWEEALQEEPNNPAPHFFLGELKIKEGNLKEGIEEIAQALLLRSLGN